MIVEVRSRAQVAIRGLRPSERAAVQRALEELSRLGEQHLRESPRFSALRPRSGVVLFSYEATSILRLIVAFESGNCIIEDVVPKERLKNYRMV